MDSPSPMGSEFGVVNNRIVHYSTISAIGVGYPALLSGGMSADCNPILSGAL
jgi:hypothetical protein